MKLFNKKSESLSKNRRNMKILLESNGGTVFFKSGYIFAENFDLRNAYVKCLSDGKLAGSFLLSSICRIEVKGLKVSVWLF